MPPIKVMVTGVYGLIAGEIYKRLQAAPDRYDVYALARRRQPSDRVAEGRALDVPDEKFVLSDLSDLDGVRQAVDGLDVVVHMAADPRPEASFERILNSNLIGTYNVFEACRLAGVKRVVYASSVQATLGYRTDAPYRLIAEGRFDEVPADFPIVTRAWAPRPQNIYACSKVWGEALARSYADVHGLSCICLRIGWVVAEDRPPAPNSQDIWCSQRDIVQLTERCINAPESVRFDIFYGMSNNDYRWVDIDHAREVVGYVPQDRAEDHLV